MWEPKVSIPTLDGPFVVRLVEGDIAGLAPGDFPHIRLSVMSWIALLTDSPLDPLKPRGSVRSFLKKVCTDLYGLLGLYSSLAHRLVSSVEIRDGCVVNTTYIKEMEKTPVFREYLHFLRTKDIVVFRFVYTFLVFLKKGRFDRAELQSQSLRKWLDVEASFDRALPDPIVDHLHYIVGDLLSCWNETDFLPIHGKGAVSERGIRSIEQKNNSFYLTPPLEAMYSSRNGYQPYPSEFAQSRRCDASSRLLFVPKTFGSLRSVCPEPIPRQWGQQGVRLWLEETISDALGGFVSLPRQGINRSAAEFGSLTGLVDTIDLSSASDSVAWELVQRVFPGKVVNHFAATRSHTVELPSGEIFRIRKFAPMGSSLCFPAQTILYSAVVILASVLWRHVLDGTDISMLMNHWRTLFSSNLSTRNSILLQPFRCYGDDIVCDKRTTSNVMILLQLLGFSVNREKSFTGDQAFRESCGGFYLYGHDVTPFQLKLQPFSNHISIVGLGSCIDACNLLATYGYHRCRSVLINFINRYPITNVPQRDGLNPVLYTENSDESMAVRVSVARNTHLERRPALSTGTALDYQRDEWRSISLRTRGDGEVVRYDNYHYTAWWRSKYHATKELPSRVGSVAASTVTSVPCWRWTPAG